MAGGDPIRGPGSLQGRGSECALLDDVLAALRAGESRTLLMHGEAGIGKTALLNYAVCLGGRPAGPARRGGSSRRWSSAFASCTSCVAPLLDAVEQLPPPQRGRPRGRVRPDRRAGAGSIPRRAGGPHAAFGGGRGASAPLRRRRRAVAGRGIGQDARLRRTAAPRGASRTSPCGARRPPGIFAGSRSWRFLGSGTGTRARCCVRASCSGSTSGSAIASSPRRAAIPSVLLAAAPWVVGTAACRWVRPVGRPAPGVADSA
jgi:hypothetical protein